MASTLSPYRTDGGRAFERGSVFPGSPGIDGTKRDTVSSEIVRKWLVFSRMHFSKRDVFEVFMRRDGRGSGPGFSAGLPLGFTSGDAGTVGRAPARRRSAGCSVYGLAALSTQQGTYNPPHSGVESRHFTVGVVAMDAKVGKGGSASMQQEMWGARVKDWAEIQEDTILPLFKEVLTKTGVGSETNLLDVGCGSGRFCQMAAERGASVSGIDATPAMIDMAKSRTPTGDFRAGEMEALPYGGNCFHVVTGFNSFQYAANPVNALREACRVARKDSVVVMAVWGKASDCQAASYVATLFKFLPPPPPGATGPFGLSEDGTLEALARQAGLTPIEVNDVVCPWVYKDMETALRGLLSAGPAAKAIQISGEDRVREVVVKVLEPFRNADGGYRLENKFRYIVART